MEKVDQLKLENIYKDIQSGTLAKASQNSNFQKIKISRKEDSTFYVEQFTQKQAFQKQLKAQELLEFLKENIGKNFKHVYLETQEGRYSFLTNKKGKTRLLTQKASNPSSPASMLTCPGQNRKKKYIIEEGIPVPFLIQLGVMNSEGKVISQKYDKFRQINRFLEYIRDILPELRSEFAKDKLGLIPKNAADDPIRIVDFGCGKSYLTFAVYHYLHEILKLNVEIIGLDLKDDVITMCSLLAKEFGYDKLNFYTSSIEDYFENNTSSKVDLVITLHACDTATDYALASAIRQGAKAILSVPCCQHELNQNIKEVENKGLNAMLKYGILKERFLALATDAMRCELLEKCGYKTQLLEFVDMSHTPKNLLIRAVLGKSERNSDYDEISKLLGQDISLARLLK
ncbi:MAG: SAM-dependent methyltransferase [Treponemataceae bacterium]|nr:SAM-dependent methyltransferase [Treponemataceae bacterium]